MIATIATIAEKKQNFSDRSDQSGHFVFSRRLILTW